MLALLRVGSTIVACQSGSGGGGEPGIGAAPTISSDHEISLPLDAYALSRHERDVVDKAVDVAANACMARFGLSWPPPYRPPAKFAQNARAYGVISPVDAARYGYHPPLPEGVTPADAARLAQEDSGRSASTTATQRAVYTGNGFAETGVQGVPAGGCLGEARVSIGAPTAPDTFVQTLRNEAHEASETDSRVRDLFDRWSSCMAKSGYKYTDPREAHNDDRWWDNSGGGMPTPVEIAVATADVRCKQELNLVGVWVAVESAYQQQAIDDNVEQLTQSREQYTTLMTNARQVLGT
ncbi:hypothetical protein OG216_26945 [Streptomycetaceae bacterium NBC_01309]